MQHLKTLAIIYILCASCSQKKDTHRDIEPISLPPQTIEQQFEESGTLRKVAHTYTIPIHKLSDEITIELTPHHQAKAQWLFDKENQRHRKNGNRDVYCTTDDYIFDGLTKEEALLENLNVNSVYFIVNGRRIPSEELYWDIGVSHFTAKINLGKYDLRKDQPGTFKIENRTIHPLYEKKVNLKNCRNNSHFIGLKEFEGKQISSQEFYVFTYLIY